MCRNDSGLFHVSACLIYIICFIIFVLETQECFIYMTPAGIMLGAGGIGQSSEETHDHPLTAARSGLELTATVLLRDS